MSLRSGGSLPGGRTLTAVDILDDRIEPSDDDRPVDFDADEAPLLPEQTRDDLVHGWGDRAGANDDRLLEDRPPHWG